LINDIVTPASFAVGCVAPQADVLVYALDAHGNVASGEGVAVVLEYGPPPGGSLYGLGGDTEMTSFYGLGGESDTLLVAEEAGWDPIREAFVFQFMTTRAGRYSVEVTKGTSDPAVQIVPQGRWCALESLY
jgi:hypothetical protein